MRRVQQKMEEKGEGYVGCGVEKERGLLGLLFFPPLFHRRPFSVSLGSKDKGEVGTAVTCCASFNILRYLVAPGSEGKVGWTSCSCSRNRSLT